MSPSVRFCVCGECRSGTRGYSFAPIGVAPRPSIPWQVAQRLRKASRPCCNAAGSPAMGFTFSLSACEMAKLRTDRASFVSSAPGVEEARNPRHLIKAAPKAPIIRMRNVIPAVRRISYLLPAQPDYRSSDNFCKVGTTLYSRSVSKADGILHRVIFFWFYVRVRH